MAPISLNTEITSLDIIGSLPVGSVVMDSERRAWQKAAGGDWTSTSPLLRPRASVLLLRQFGPSLLLVWLPTDDESTR